MPENEPPETLPSIRNEMDMRSGDLSELVLKPMKPVKSCDAKFCCADRYHSPEGR